MTEETFDQQITLSLRRVEALWQKAHELLKLPPEASQTGEEFPTQPQQLLMASLAELSHSLQELQFAAEELRQQNEKLTDSRVAIDAERQRYQELFNFAPDGYFVTDPEAMIIEANQAAAQLLNLSPERLVGKSLVVFVATQERRDFYYKLSQLQRGESIHHWPVQIQPRGGDSFLASFTVAPIRNSQSQVMGLRWRLEDLTAARHRESSQKPSKHLFCERVERSLIGIAIVDSQGYLIDSNRTLAEMLGCDSEGLKQVFPELMNLDKPGVESAMFHQLIAGERRSYQLEKHWFNADGEMQWGHLTIALVPSTEEEPVYATCILEDITEQKQLKAAQQDAIKQQQAIQQQQAALKQLETEAKIETATPKPPEQPTQNLAASVEQLGTLLDTILSNSNDFFWVLDRAGKYIYVNQAAAKAWGFTQNECIGKTWRELTLPGEVMEQLDVQRETVLTMGQFVTDETSLTTVEGVRDFEYTIARLGDSDSEEMAAIVTFKDITEQKQAAVAASAALAKEAELTALKSHFANFTSIVTQELRNPLNNIFSYAKIIENNHQEGIDENNSNYLQRIQENARWINQLLNDLVLIKKIQTREVRLTPTSLDLTEFCRELTAELQESTSSQHQIVFVSECQSVGAWDEKLLRRTLTNLLLNAMHYCPDDSEIKVELLCQDEQVIFHIRDCGIGIPDKDKKLLFNGFHQGSNMSLLNGSGLGLWVVKQCVDLQGGSIDVESQVGVGTRVTVTLPVRG